MESKNILHDCLYFTANALARVITRMGEEAFRRTGLSPSHAFLVMLVNEKPGIGQKELAENLQLAPSTVTRFVDSLVHKGYLTRLTEGKSSKVFPTDEGKRLKTPIEKAWHELHMQYAKILGRREGDALTAMIDAASDKLNKQE
jgi:DNA-binding MarR family transcriptional regulator